MLGNLRHAHVARVDEFVDETAAVERLASGELDRALADVLLGGQALQQRRCRGYQDPAGLCRQGGEHSEAFGNDVLVR